MTDGFSFKRNYRLIRCDEPGYEGFEIRVRAGISNDERDALTERWRELVDYNVAYREMEPVDRERVNESGDTPRRREWQLLAPLIVGWNAVGDRVDETTGETEEAPLPPPAEAGAEVFACVPADLLGWMRGCVLDGYVVSGKALDSLPKSTATSGPQIVRSEEDGGGSAACRRRRS